MNNTIIYLIGHYGVGKLTIAKQLCATSGARLFDNHLVNNVIFSLIREDGSAPIPDRAWDLIMTVRDQAITAIAEIARPDASFVLTNALMEDDPLDHKVYAQIADMAARRNGVFVPVILSASDAAHAERIPSEDREQRLKMTDVTGAAHVRQTRPLLAIDHPNLLQLDTTHLPPDQAARTIIEHAERLQ
ncbi:chloramphenicol phosphotransferase [Devosia sp. 2618]|uniref:chloramphenicol phosphotransferase n=1 Tax=Devosia sp. 2618 TaxID=3156454 RepID=UPI0033965A32